jgi:hypothetical protein
MELMQRTLQALEKTRLLAAALEVGDLVRCAAMIEERETALAAFAETHRRASAEEIADCRETIAALVTADEALVHTAERRRDAAARDMEQAPRHSAEDASPLTACLDRHA